MDPLVQSADGEAAAYAVEEAVGAAATGQPSLAVVAAVADAASASCVSTGPTPYGMDDIPESIRALASVQGGRGYLPDKRLAPRVISSQNAWLMSDIMHDVTMRGTALRTRALGRNDLAGKTGTTNEGRDNWFNGFTRDLVASVWVGFDDYQTLGAGAEGSTTAVPIWMHYMKEALKEVPSSRLPRPPGLIDLRVSPYTGTLTSALNPEAITETFMVDHLPRAPRPGEDAFTPAGAGAEPGATRGEPLF